MSADSRIWQNLPEPLHGSADMDLLWEAEQALQSIVDLGENPDIRNAFVRRLESFRSELEKAAHLVANTEYKVAFIGDIGVGKTTALCRIVGLEIPSGMPDVSLPNPALEVGGGGTTVCEVQIVNGMDYGLVVEPRSEDELREEVVEFARILMPSSDADLSDETNADPDGGTRIAREVSRAIRNMSGLQSELQRNAEGRIVGRYDHAQKLAEELADADALANAIWEKMALHKRTGHELWYCEAGDTPNVEPLIWLQENFRLLNNGRHPDFSLPQRVEVILPQRILDERFLSIRIVDTKGIDDTAEREDLMSLLNESHTIAVLCSPFNAAPAISVQQILERSLEARYPDLETKAAILTLPRAGEALAMRDYSGDPVTSTMDGYFYKGEQAKLSLSTANLPNVPVEFFNTHEDDTEECSAFLMNLVTGLQNLYCARLEEVVIDALALVENYESEQARAVQRQAATHLATWLDANRHVKPMIGRLQDSLMRAIDTVNASSLRASVRRSGEWHNLNYPQQLSHGARVTAAGAADHQLDEFRAIIENLLRNPDLTEASGLLQQARRIIASGSESLLAASQRMGREVHSEQMKPDTPLWDRCVGEWGQGPGYKGRVANHNRNWFDGNQHGITATLEELVASEWAQILSQVESILSDSDSDEP